MVLSPRKKAFVFAAGLLLVSTVLVGSAVATTNSALQPFLRGEAFAKERGLTRGGFVTLAILVGQEQDGQLKGIEGATVKLVRANSSDVLAEKTTGPLGGAIFELKRGSYEIQVKSSAGDATKHLALAKSTRMGVAFDSEGNPHWQSVDHQDLERRGEHKRLLVRVGEAREGGRPAPVEGAKISVYRINPDNTTTFVSEKTTGPRGFADWALPKGGYLIKLETPNATGEQRVRLQGDLIVGAVVDGHDIEWRVQRDDAHDFQRPPPRRTGAARR